jgi:hypothetical protein
MVLVFPCSYLKAHPAKYRSEVEFSKPSKEL